MSRPIDVFIHYDGKRAADIAQSRFAVRQLVAQAVRIARTSTKFKMECLHCVCVLDGSRESQEEGRRECGRRGKGQCSFDIQTEVCDFEAYEGSVFKELELIYFVAWRQREKTEKPNLADKVSACHCSFALA